MTKPVALVALLVAATMAGCIAADTDPDTGDPAGSLLMTEDPASHPAFGFYTRGAPVDASVVPDAWVPPAARPTPDEPMGFESVAAVDGLEGGNGIALFGHYAFVGTSGGNLRVVDIADPAKPKVVAEADDIPVRDAATIAYPDGRLILVTASGGDHFAITDVTDPTAPEKIANVKTKHTNHNIAVVPGTPMVYNSASGSAATDIYDLTDPDNAVLVQDWANGYACHDIAFYVNASEEKYRAYCAGRAVTQIWDIADPKAPEIVIDIPYPALGIEGTGGTSPVTFSHLAIVNHDASVLLVGDETGGGAAPACDAYVETPLGTESGPLGNLWFYDISDETDPVLHGHVSPPASAQSGSCTAHFGEVVADTDHAVVGFYTAGTVLVDFRDIDSPRIKDYFGGASVWDAQYYQGYVFTGDMGRGMDIAGLI